MSNISGWAEFWPVIRGQHDALAMVIATRTPRHLERLDHDGGNIMTVYAYTRLFEVIAQTVGPQDLRVPVQGLRQWRAAVDLVWSYDADLTVLRRNEAANAVRLVNETLYTLK